MDIRQDANEARLTSLSVGDTVTIKNEEDGSITSYICENLGWKKQEFREPTDEEVETMRKEVDEQLKDIDIDAL